LNTANAEDGHVLVLLWIGILMEVLIIGVVSVIMITAYIWAIMVVLMVLLIVFMPHQSFFALWDWIFLFGLRDERCCTLK